MKRFLLFVIFAFPISLFAGDENSEWFECIIDDSDGYVFVRSGQGKDNPIIDTVFENSFFYVYGDTSSSWLHVQVPDGKTGYMHKSRVQYFFTLDSLSQYNLISDALNDMIRAEKGGDYYERNDVFEEKFLPAYGAFEKMYCRQPNNALLSLYFRTLTYLGGSADEGKDWTSAAMWVCHPTEVKMTICSLGPNTQQCAINSIKTGMAMSGKEDLYTPGKLKLMYADLDRSCE